jgi:glutaredoxin 3
MKKITIYTTSICPYCTKAKSLLDSKNLSYEEINIEDDERLREEMMQKSSNRRTVPQIFIGDHHVGGCDDLYLLDQKGELNQLLA